jgi:hypothetical protein
VLWTLEQFVIELVSRYGLKEAVVPPCWFKHEAIIQELLALFQYRNQQQYLPIAPASAPIDFHYYFQLALTRLRNWVNESGCTLSRHHDSRTAPWVTPGTGLNAQHVQDFEEYLANYEKKGMEIED